jgi:hypothetical protein
MEVIVEHLPGQVPCPALSIGMKQIRLMLEAGFGNLSCWLVFQLNLESNELGASAIFALDEIGKGQASRIVIGDLRTRNSANRFV